MLFQQNPNGSKMDKSKEGHSKLIIACSDPAENFRPLSPDRRQVRHHRLPGGAGHPPPDRGHLDPGGHGHSLRLLRQHRQPRPGQAHQRGVHRPDCQRSPPANAGGRLAGRQGRLSEKPPCETEVLHRKSPESRILQKKLGNLFRGQAAALCNMLFL